MLPRECVPETAILRTRIVIEGGADRLCSYLVLLLAGLLMQYQKKVSRQHVVECSDLAIDHTKAVDMLIDPALDVFQQGWSPVRW
jgi:hypothetical protein